MPDLYEDLYSDLYGSSSGGSVPDPVPTGEATVATVIALTRRLLEGSRREELNKLAVTVDSAATTVQTVYAPDGIANGTYLDIDDELFYVWSVDAGAKRVEVERAMVGTTAASHSSGVLIRVNPRFPQAMIRQALKEELRSWGPRVYATTTIEVTPTTVAVDLTGIGEFFHVLSVVQSPASGEDNWFPVRYRQLENLSLSDFASGKAIMLDDEPPTGARYRVTVARPFVLTQMSDSIDLQAQVGVAASMLDILPIGAAWRLMLAREINRAQVEAQGQPRNAAEVPPGHILQTAQSLKQARDARLTEEAFRLALHYPPNNLR